MHNLTFSELRLVDCPDFSNALYAARKALEESTEATQ